MKLAIQLFLLFLALWWSHIAGIAYLRAKGGTGLPIAAIIRTILSVIAAVMVLIV